MSKVELNQSEKAVEVIRSLIKSVDGLKLKEHASKTGFSYFTGKKRFCKVLKTKKGAKVEINVVLPKKLSSIPEIETISLDKARKLHLGTMKHILKSNDEKLIKEVLSAAFKVFVKETQVEEAKPSKEA